MYMQLRQWHADSRREELESRQAQHARDVRTVALVEEVVDAVGDLC